MMRRVRSIALLLVGLGVCGQVFAQSAEADRADAEHLVAALHLAAGATACEIGAGSGELTVRIAESVGEAGRVYSNELNGDRRKEIEKAAREARLANVIVVEGKPSDTNIPPNTCDAVFMRDVYHHFAEPVPMNASLLAALKPGGRIAVIDFTPPPGHESPDPAGRGKDGQHGILPETLVRELREAGFGDLSSEWLRSRMFIVVGARPLPR